MTPLARHRVSYILGLALVGFFPVAAHSEDAPPAEVSDRELEAHATSLRVQSQDSKLDIIERESFISDLVSLLDRAAQSASDPKTRRKHWNQAITEIDEFERNNPTHPLSTAYRFRAAVLRWASARDFRHQFELNPNQLVLREGAIAELDDALKRLRALEVSEGEKEKAPTLAANIQYRLAQALADRADFEPSNSESQGQLVTESMEAVKKANTEPALQGYAKLLSGELSRRQGKIETALSELAEASKATPPPPERQLVGVRHAVLLAAKRFDESLKLVQASGLNEPVKRYLTAETHLAQRADLNSGADRYAIEAALFDDLSALRAKGTAEYRLALLSLAKARIEPDPRLGSEAWDLMAEAQDIIGDSIRASSLYNKAAVRAEDSGYPEQAEQFRLKAGALLFRAGHFMEAESALGALSKSSKSSDPTLRAKANMLRALSLGRALAAKSPGASLKAYRDALEMQIHDFPTVSSTDEARWLLGTVLQEEGNQTKARELWSAIDIKSPRWLESRRAVAALDRVSLMNEWISTGSKPGSTPVDQASRFLARSASVAPNTTLKNELLLLEAFLEVTPEVGRADEARELAERVNQNSPTRGQKYRSALVRMIAMTYLGRYIESEMVARDLGVPQNEDEASAFLDAVRLLDRAAALAETDLRQRRFGTLSRMLLTPLFARGTLPWDGKTVAELHMRLTRGLIFSGDERAAKGSLASWKNSSQVKEWNDSLLRDLADTYARLGAHGLALDVHRMRLRSLRVGSPSWFDAKYGTALALYRAGMIEDSLQLIDATALLHPDLGGSVFKEKFQRLRERLSIGP